MAQHKLISPARQHSQETRLLRRRWQPVSASQRGERRQTGPPRVGFLGIGWHGKTREMGLGPLALVSLAEARDKALACRKLLLEGTTPSRHGSISGRRRGWTRRRQSRSVSAPTATSRRMKRGGEAQRHRYQWRQTMDTACETLGDLPVAAVDTGLVLQGAGADLDHQAGNRIPPARAHRGGARLGHGAQATASGDNPARWRGHLDNLLPKTSKLARVQHHPALPYAERAAVHGRASRQPLDQRPGAGVRDPDGVPDRRGARGQVERDDLSKAWTIPPERMKGDKEHRVPLSSRALAILSSLPREEGNPFVFVGGATGQPLGGMAMRKLLKRMRPGLTVMASAVTSVTGRPSAPTIRVKSPRRRWRTSSRTRRSAPINAAICSTNGAG